MSVSVQGWAWNNPATQHLGVSATMVLLALADIADDDGNVIYGKDDKRSQAALAKKTRMSVSTLKRMIAQLVGDGLLEVDRDSKREVNRYRIIMRAQSELSTSEPGQLTVSPLTAHHEPSDSSPGELSSTSTPLLRHRYQVNQSPVVPKGTNEIDEAFDQVWSMWPSHRRGTRKKSGSSFRTAVKAIGGVKHLPELLAAVEAHTNVWRSWPEYEQRFVPMMTTWLNQERWTGALPEGRQGSGLSVVEQGRRVDEILRAREVAS